MMREITPTLTIGFGNAGGRIVKDLFREVKEYEPSLVEYKINQFVLFNSDKVKNNYIYNLTIDGEADFHQKKRKIENLLLDRIHYLQSYQLPEEENSYAVKGAAEVTRMIRFFIVNDLEEKSSDLFVNQIFPTFLDLLKTYNVYSRPCLVLSIAVFTRDEKTKSDILERLMKINSLTQEVADIFPIRIYLLDKYVREGVSIGSKDNMIDLASLFLQNLLLSDLNSSKIKKNIDFLTTGDPDSPYSTLGISTIDFPIPQVIDYCTKKEFCRLVEQIIKEDETNTAKEGSNWAQACDLRSSLPTGEFDRPAFAEEHFSVFTSNDQLKDKVTQSAKESLVRASKWTEEKLSKVEEQVITIKKESTRNLTKKGEQLRNRVNQIFRGAKNSSYSSLLFLRNVWKTLASKKEKVELPIWRPVFKPNLEALYPRMNKLFSSIERRPNAKAVIFHCLIFFLVGAFLLTNISLPAYGLVKSIFSPVILFSIITFLMGFFIIFIPHQLFKLAYKNLIVDFNSYVELVNQIFRNNLLNITLEYEIRALEQLTARAKRDYQWINLVNELFKDKQEKFTTELKEIERLKRQAVKDTRFRKYIAKEKDFLEIFQKQNQQTEIQSILRNFDEEFRPLDKIFKLSPYEFFEESYDFVNSIYSKIKETDYFSSEYKEYRDRLKKKIESEVKRILFYLVPFRAKIREETLESYFFFSGKEEYQTILAESKLSPQPEIMIPLSRPNRVYLWKVMWGIPFEAVEVKD